MTAADGSLFASPAAAREPLHVLLVEDDRQALDDHASLLEHAGLTCSREESAVAAMSRLAACTPDAIVIDFHLAGTGGPELATRIRSSAVVPEASILLLSPARANGIAECIASGVELCLESPVQPGVFTALVRSQAAKARQLKVQRLQLAAALREVQYRQLALDKHAVVSMADGHGDIIYANDKLTDLSGYSQDELIGRNHRILKSGRHPPSFYAELWRTISSGEVWQGVLCNRHKSGRLYWVQATIMPLLETEARPTRFTSVQTDITQPVFREHLAASEAMLLGSTEGSAQCLAKIVVGEIESLVHGAVGAVLLFDPKRPVLHLAAAPQLSEAYREAIAGLAEQPGAIPCDAAASRGEEVFVADLAAHPDFRDFCDLATAAGLRACWSIPIRAAEGPVLGTLTLYLRQTGLPAPLELETGRRLARITGLLLSRLRHAAALRAAEAELRHAEQRANLAIDGAHLGYWDVDIETGKGIVNRRWHELHGYAAAEVGDAIHDRWLDRLHPDDRERTLEAGRRYKRGEIPHYDVEYRLLLPSGEVRWFNSRGAIIERGEEGRPRRIAGVCQDITRRRLAEQTAARQAKLLGILQEGVQGYLTGGELVATADFLLRGVIDLTGSEYGFTGEILHDAAGAPYLKTHALTNIAWDEATRRLYAEKSGEGLEFHNLNTLFGAVISTGAAVISNDPANDPRRGGLPDGHPPLRAFLGIPVYNGAELVAMYGLANRAGGYDAGCIDLLAPFDASYAAIVASQRDRRLRQRLVDELKAAKDAAEAASGAKSAFLASMSHELRTPLNAILGYAQLIAMEDGIPADAARLFQQWAQEIQQAGQHLLSLINEVLDLARIEAGRMQIVTAPVPLEPLLVSCTAMAATLARQRAIALDLDRASCEDLYALGDETRLKQVVINFVSNAIKYNRADGYVRIHCARGGDDRVRILVSDNGPGIPTEKQGQLFGAFERLGAEKSAVEGTGIGLVISKHLVEMMAGRVGFESHVGEGSTFWVELPRCKSEPQLQPAVSTRLADATGQAKTVLHIEDNPINIMLIGDILARQPSLRVINATTAEDGLELARQHVPDLILLDIRLPGMDGYAALAQLRQMESLASTPVIAVTASAMKHEAERGLAAGFNAYVTKPLDIPQFLELIDRHLSDHG